MSIIRIKDLSLRTFIGFKPHEKKYKQDILVNIEIEVDSRKSEKSDSFKERDFFDYRNLSKSLIQLIEESKYDLLEALVKRVLDEIMLNNLVKRAKVEIEKPNALRYSRSVSIEISQERI